MILKDNTLDYLCPQIYFGYRNDSQPFNAVLSRWKQLCAGSSCALMAGLPFYKSGQEDTWAGSGKSEFLTPGVLPGMTEQLLADPGISGLVYYSLGSMTAAKGTALVDYINCRGRLLEAPSSSSQSKGS